MRKKNGGKENYLEKIPVRSEKLSFEENEEEIVTLSYENKGVFNRIAQKLFKKPKISYVHLDAHGSFIWLLIDGERNIASFGNDIKAKFGEEAEPLYPRLTEYFRRLESYGFVNFKN